MNNDEQLQSDVEQELRQEPSVRAERIGVSVKNGVVELDGHVDSYCEKWAAERAAVRVSNARGVSSEIKVELPTSTVRTDEDIAHTAPIHLDRNYAVPNTVKVLVTDGWLTLIGTTEWQYQKEEVERAVPSLTGLKLVSNEIAVTLGVNAAEVKIQIESALKRFAETGSNHIAVVTSDGKVTLHGHVRTWGARKDAEHLAWAAPGVTRVVDLITVR